MLKKHFQAGMMAHLFPMVTMDLGGVNLCLMIPYPRCWATKTIDQRLSKETPATATVLAFGGS